MLDVPLPVLEDEYGEHFFPDRAKLAELPPRDPVLYRLYEALQVYGYAYKNIIAEKFGDGIMSAISFSTKVEREEDDKGVWVKVSSSPPSFSSPFVRMHLIVSGRLLNVESFCLILGFRSQYKYHVVFQFHITTLFEAPCVQRDILYWS